jgi:O-acetylserine/cysteine efflux transporter
MKPFDIALALLVVCIWGVNFVVIKIGLQGLPPILFTALRFLFAALPLVFFVKRPAIAWPLLLAYGLFQFALQFTLLFTGIQLGFPPGLASLVIQLQAFFTIGMAVLFLGERPRLLQLAAALVTLAGMALVAAHLDAKPTTLGFFLIIAAAVCWACANMATKKMPAVQPLALMIWGSLIAVPPLLAASLAVDGITAWQLAFAQLKPVTVGAVLFQSYPNTLLGFGIWAMLMKKYATATIAPFSLLVPVAGMLSAALVLGEALQWWKIGAGLLVLAGLALNVFESGRRARLAAGK